MIPFGSTATVATFRAFGPMKEGSVVVRVSKWRHPLLHRRGYVTLSTGKKSEGFVGVLNQDAKKKGDVVQVVVKTGPLGVLVRVAK